MTSAPVSGSDYTNRMVGFHVTDLGGGVVTVSKSGTSRDASFDSWYASQSEAVQLLLRNWIEGKRGKLGQYRLVTRTSLTFNADTLTLGEAATVAMGPSDAEDVLNT